MNFPLLYIVTSIENIQVLFNFYLNLFDEKRLEKSIKLLLFNIKSLNPMSKYPNIIEFYKTFRKYFDYFQVF